MWKKMRKEKIVSILFQVIFIFVLFRKPLCPKNPYSCLLLPKMSENSYCNSYVTLYETFFLCWYTVLPLPSECKGTQQFKIVDISNKESNLISSVISCTYFYQ